MILLVGIDFMEIVHMMLMTILYTPNSHKWVSGIIESQNMMYYRCRTKLLVKLFKTTHFRLDAGETCDYLFIMFLDNSDMFLRSNVSAKDSVGTARKWIMPE